jgi:putative peptidoglycan lipid II flippase
MVEKAAAERTGRAAFLVGAGILLSRIAGLVRQSVFAHYFGNSPIAGAFQAAFRIPNILQNLFGEGVLSASFIPEYAGLLASGKQDDADELAVAVGTALALVSAVVVALGVFSAPLLVDIFASGFPAELRPLTITLVQILFPGAALLVCSAWCLGVLNSHRRFLLSYSAPLAWNAAMIGALLWYGPAQAPAQLAVTIAWASIVGSALQFAVQVPSVVRLSGRLGRRVSFMQAPARRVFRNFLPAFMSRGVVQLSSYIDLMLAGALGTAASIAVSGLAYAQVLYMLPGSLFGMAVTAAELPAMASVTGDAETIHARLRERLNAGMARIAFYIVPSIAAFLVLGDVIIGGILQSGRFHAEDTRYVWMILAGSTVGLLASTLGRLDSSTYFALRDPRTPMRFAIVRIVLTTVLGYVTALHLPRWLGVDLKYGAVGLAASAGVAGWVEFVLLRRGLTKKIGHTGLVPKYVATLWGAAGPAVALAWAVKSSLPPMRPIFLALIVLPVYGVLYLALSVGFRIPEASLMLGRVRRKVRL